MNEYELLEQMSQYLEEDAPHLLRDQNLSERQLEDAAASKAGYHYNGRWTESEQQVIDAVSDTYQHFFIVSARGYRE